MINFKTVISRTSYTRGNRCKKSLWLHRNRPTRETPISNEGKLIKLASHDVVEIAAELFDQAPYPCSVFGLDEEKNWDASVESTRQAIEKGECLLAHPAFYAKDLMCDVHYLKRSNNGKWSAYVVKSSTKISDKSKEKAAFQLLTLISAGLEIEHFYFLTINNQYVREKELDIRKLFRKRDILKELSLTLNELRVTVSELHYVLEQHEAPKTEIGEYCLSPYDCDFKSQCWKNVPKNSVFELGNVSKETKFKWWNDGVKTQKQLQQSKYQAGVKITEEQNEGFIDKNALNEFLGRVEFPILFLDFEGYLPALPPYSGIKPFQIIPFLFAAYKSNSFEENPSFEAYIAPPKHDPRKIFAEKLIELCNDVNSILVYDPLTEKQVIKSLILSCPELESELKEISGKIIDLAKPIQNKQFYLPAMNGLSSMKYVLPAVAPNTDYSSLEVQSGRAASQLYQILCTENHDRDTEAELENLVNYCKMDVHGLVMVFNAFLEAVGKPRIEEKL